MAVALHKGWADKDAPLLSAPPETVHSPPVLSRSPEPSSRPGGNRPSPPETAVLVSSLDGCTLLPSSRAEPGPGALQG